MLDAIKNAGLDVISVGKINDIFAGAGITESTLTHSNTEGMQLTSEIAERDFHGLCFTNLVDFDMLYGHRQDTDGYAAALSEFDGWLSGFVGKLGEEDTLIITADHGCDPGDNSTDHTREYVPLIIYNKAATPENLGTRFGFYDIAERVTEMLGVDFEINGDQI
jgi:phosphopentomutase